MAVPHLHINLYFPCVQAQLRICVLLHSTHVKIPVPLRLTFVVDEASSLTSLLIKMKQHLNLLRSMHTV